MSNNGKTTSGKAAGEPKLRSSVPKEKNRGRAGLGRKKGTHNKNKAALAEIINKEIPPEERVRLVAELARGVLVEEPDGHGGVKVYSRAPDMVALRHLEEFSTGKPIQRVEGIFTHYERIDVRKLAPSALVRLAAGDYSVLDEMKN